MGAEQGRQHVLDDEDVLHDVAPPRDAAPDEGASPPGTVSRRRLLATTVATAALTAAGTFAGTSAAAHPGRRSPTYRVSPRPETATTALAVTVVWRTSPAERLVCLTFDDGPDPRWTPTVLDVLDRHGAQATFFQLGDAVAAHPGVAADVVAAGHEVANHGWGHRDLTLQTAAETLQDLRATHDEIAAATGVEPVLVRPTWGRMDAPVMYAAAEMGYTVALWSHHLPTDGAAAKVDRNIETASPGMIVLCHDGRGTPAESLYVEVDRLVATLSDDGYRFVTVSGLLAAEPA